jgi:hypothetical protein
VTNVDGTTSIFGVSCPSVTLCVAVDNSGNVITSTNPTGGTGAWTVANVAGGNGLSAVSCTSTTLCVAVDVLGNAFSATNPTGGASAWTATSLHTLDSPSGVSCPVVGLCVEVDLAGYVAVGTSPPSTTTGSAGSIGSTTATLSGSENPNGLAVTGCHFTYGIGTPSGATVPCTALPGSGQSTVSVSAPLSGLTAGVTYEFQLVATSTGGTSTGAVGSFTTHGFSLTVSKAGAGSGTVTSLPAGIQCGNLCSTSYKQGTSVTLTPTPASNSRFAGWSGACTGTGACRVTMSASRAVTASFSLKKCVVPKLEGKTLKAAKRSLRSHNCRLGKVRHAASRKVRKGRVISQKPKPGKRLRYHAAVNVVLSTGKH